jgi:hypothetical protein
MIIHFNSQTEAVDHLRNSDFRRLQNGAWVSPSKDVAATIHPTHTKVVQVAYREILRVGA